MRRGRRGKEKEWTDCVQSDIRAFGIAGGWKATALEAEVWVGEVVIAHESAEFCEEATPIGVVDESKESLYGRETDRDHLRSA